MVLWFIHSPMGSLILTWFIRDQGRHEWCYNCFRVDWIIRQCREANLHGITAGISNYTANLYVYAIRHPCLNRNAGCGDGMAPSGDKLLPKPMLTWIHDSIWRHHSNVFLTDITIPCLSWQKCMRHRLAFAGVFWCACCAWGCTISWQTHKTVTVLSDCTTGECALVFIKHTQTMRIQI